MSDKKNFVQIVIGAAFLVAGMITSIPFFLQEKTFLAILSVISIIVGLVLLALAFGDAF